MRRAFTLIELLTIVAIIGAMASVAMISFGSGQGAARIKGASRDIFATIRQARSIALVTQKPAIITYSEKEIDGEICAKIEITTARMMTGGVVQAETLSGEIVMVGEEEDPGAEVEGSGGGETIEDILFAPIAEDVVRGIRIKVAKGDELLQYEERDEGRQKARISVFSNIDYLLGRYSEERKKEESASEEEDSAGNAAVETGAKTASTAQLQEETSFVWEVNGRCTAHRIWVYREGTEPNSGLCIKVDRFGGAKIVSGDEE